MRAKDIASRLTGRMRQFRATSLGEFAVALIIFPLLLSVAPTPAFAVDAVWLPSAPSGVWNLGTNWNIGIAPVNPGDTATFNTSTQTSPTINAPVTINSITFNSGASVFSIQVAPFVPLTLQGGGIVNLTPTTQTIINGGPASITAFTAGATAGNATIFNSGANSFTLFTTGATAGNATINNTGVLNLTSFMAGATAGNATINNSGDISFTTFRAPRPLGVRRLTTLECSASHHSRARPLGRRRLTTAVRAASHHLLRARPLGMRRLQTAEVGPSPLLFLEPLVETRR